MKTWRWNMSICCHLENNTMRLKGSSLKNVGSWGYSNNFIVNHLMRFWKMFGFKFNGNKINDTHELNKKIYLMVNWSCCLSFSEYGLEHEDWVIHHLSIQRKKTREIFWLHLWFYTSYETTMGPKKVDSKVKEVVIKPVVVSKELLEPIPKPELPKDGYHKEISDVQLEGFYDNALKSEEELTKFDLLIPSLCIYVVVDIYVLKIWCMFCCVKLALLSAI